MFFRQAPVAAAAREKIHLGAAKVTPMRGVVGASGRRRPAHELSAAPADAAADAATVQINPLAAGAGCAATPDLQTSIFQRYPRNYNLHVVGTINYKTSEFSYTSVKDRYNSQSVQ